MNKLLEKNIVKIFNIFILSIPILDALYGLFNNSIMTYIDYIVKAIFTCIMLYYLMFIKKKNKKYFLALLIYSIIYILINAISKNRVDMIYEIKVLLKVMFFPIVILFTLSIKDRINIKYLSLAFVSYLLLIFIPNRLNIGHNSYAITKEGSVGFYVAANVVGNILSMLFPILLWFLIKNDRKIPAVCFTIIYIYTLLTMGTKGPLICIAILFMYFIIYVFIKLIQKKKYLILVIGLILIIGMIIVFIKILPTTAFYKNLLTHLEFLNIHSFKELLTFKNIDHFVFGSRFTMLGDSFKLFKESSILHKLFGIGYTNNGILKTCEMDYFVLLIHQGIIGFILMFSAYIVLILNIVKEYFIEFKNNFMNLENSIFFIAVIISVLCAFFVGHILDVPSAVIFVGSIIALTENKLNESR